MSNDKQEFQEAFNKADKRMHPVETQWHYKILMKYGFTCISEPQEGFVRRYEYTHPNFHTVLCTTGANADYWSSNRGGWGYWSTLEEHVKEITNV